MTVVAARDVVEGEELTISYVDIFLPSRKRKERLRSWGFECACALCQGPKNETIAVRSLGDVLESPFLVETDRRLRPVRQASPAHRATEKRPEQLPRDEGDG